MKEEFLALLEATGHEPTMSQTSLAVFLYNHAGEQ